MKDISQRFESAQNQIILKASQAPQLCTGVTIGPHANAIEDQSYFGVHHEDPSSQPEPIEKPKENLQIDTNDSTPNTYPVSAAIALQELDDLRKAEVKDIVNRLVQNFTSLEQQLQGKMNEELKMLTDEMNTKSQLKKKLTENRINDDDLPTSKVVAELIHKIKQEKQRNDISKQEKAAEEKRLQAEEIENRLKYARINEILALQLQYDKVYESILENTKKCVNCAKLFAKAKPELNDLKELKDELNIIGNKVKTSSVEDRDVDTCHVILRRANQLSNRLTEKINEVNEEQRIEDEKQKQAVIAKEEKTRDDKSQLIIDENSEGNIIDKCICKESYESYLIYQKNLDNLTERLQAFVKNKSLKQFILHLKIAINTPINAVSSLSAHHMRDKYNKIVLILRGNIKLQVNDIGPDMLELYYPFCIDYLCKKFISQGEHLVPAKPEDAFSMASLILALWLEFPDFGELLLAYFMKKCPYIIPAYWPQFKGQTDKEYYSSLGYRYNDDDVIEDHNMFLKRMNGIFMLYTAIIISNPRQNKAHPHGMRYAWRWLAAALNLEPSPDITATLIHEFLKLAGFKLSQVYGLQFWKLIHLLYTEYYPRIDKVTTDDFRGPLSRLKEFLENVLKRRKFEEPVGMIHPKFW